MNRSPRTATPLMDARSGTTAEFSSKNRYLSEIEHESKLWPVASVRILRNYTAENLEPLIKYECALSQLRAEVSFSGFDAFEQEIRDPDSVTNSGAFDFILLTLWFEGLASGFGHDGQAAVEIAARLCDLIDTLQMRVPATICVTNLLPPPEALGGALLGKSRSGVGAMVAAINERVATHVRTKRRVYLIDLHQIVEKRGVSAALDWRFWYMFRSPFTIAALGDLAAEVTALVRSTKGISKKVLVLDCDNTLWGGVIGEDGIDGIALDVNTYPGNAFVDFQKQILALKSQGVILALCSKNNEADALAVFDSHPHTVLKRSDFAAWQINWNDKVSNLQAIVQSLNVGMDSVVFVDDSAAECEHVRQGAPEVSVLQVPQRPYELPRMLRDYRGFGLMIESEEDTRRTDLYADERRREDLKRKSPDLEAFLRSLELTVRVWRVGSEDVSRAAQLTQKTNQFNLTTRRYSEGQIDGFVRSPNHVVLAVRVKDRFGDYGFTGLGIIAVSGLTARIDTLLLSCRVLGRRIERVLLGELISTVRGIADGMIVEGEYRPTKKNRQVEDFYHQTGFARRGFSPVDGESESQMYVLEAHAELEGAPDFITIVREEHKDIE